MKLKIAIIIIILFLTNNNVSGQKSLTKEEIIKYWNASSNEKNEDSAIIVNSSSGLNVYLIKLVDSLRSCKIDSVMVFSTAYPGYSRILNTCDTGIFPITTFVIYNKYGLTHIKKIKGACFFEISKLSSSHLFDYYNTNKDELKSEIFMPVIFSAQINKDKTISYTWSSIDHEPNYSFYYFIGGNIRSYQFCESYIEDKKSLFYDYNLNLAAFHWWQLVKTEIDKL
jgi:hypothetical protein